MKTDVNMLQAQYISMISDAVEEYDHRYRRHGLKYAVALFYTQSETIDFNFFSQNIRKTDRFFAFENNFGVFIFDNASGDGAIKASDNMLSKYELKYFGHKIYISVASIDGYNTISEFLKKVFSTLRFAISSNISNCVVDEDDMDTIF